MSVSSDSIVNAFYLAYYGRPADPAGLKFWSQQVESANGDFSHIIDAFSSSAEASARFGSDDTADRITTIYQQLFDRAPDAAGLAYWQAAIGKGSVTLADAAIQILQGAQGGDGDLSALRLQASQQFTAAVAAGGVHYDGLAAIQAAQVLIKAVGAHATDADIATLVSETAKLVDTAAANPTVIQALATGTTLTALFDTARGDADPVGLLRTLANVGAAAAGNPDTLESLLRGGGMQKVLTVMPANATLADVADALAKGGLPAAVEVVYPTPVATPAPTPASVVFAFQSVTEGPLDSVHDNVTNQMVGDVTFSYTGTRLSVIHGFEYSTDGGQTWSSDGITSNASAKTVTIASLELGQRIAYSLPVHVNVPVSQDSTTTVYVRALDASGHAISPAAHQDIVFNARVDQPDVELVADTHGTQLGSDYDGITRNGEYTVGAEAGAKVEYASVNPSATLEVLNWSAEKPVLHEGENTFYVRATDAAGNTARTYVDLTLDTTAPSAPTVALHSDTGSSASDRVTNAPSVDIVLPADGTNASAWEYRVDGGEWTSGGLRPDGGTTLVGLNDLLDGIHKVEARQYDVAGNVSESGTLEFTLDHAAPTTQLQFTSLEGAASGNVTTVAKPDVTFGYDSLEQGAHVEWSTDGRVWHADGVSTDAQSKTVTIADVDLSQADLTLQVHVVDAAGNAGAALGVALDSTVNDPVLDVPSTIAGRAQVDGSNGNLAVIYLNTTPNPIAWHEGTNLHGFGNPDTLLVEDMSTGSPTPTATDFTDGSQFAALNGGVRLDSLPALDLYRMSWSDDTFLTTGGHVSAGSTMFVVGQGGPVFEAGFGIDWVMNLQGGAVGYVGDDANVAYIDNGQSATTVLLGGGYDLVADNGGTLTLNYDRFAASSHDVILGFDTGNDKIQLDNDARSAVDANGDHLIQWASNRVVTASTEAVEFDPNVRLYTGGGNSQGFNERLTVDNLNHALNVSQVAQGHSLLLLANSTSGGGSGALMLYQNLDGDGVIGVNELTFVNVFTGGIVHAADIKVVGTPIL